jgi:hypothetical protein
VLPNPEDRKRTLHLLVTLLPKPNRDIMEALFVFLRWVASFSYRDEETGSRMDLANLATVICPSILYGKGQSAAREESMIAIQAVQQLLEQQDDIYHVPTELQFATKISSIFIKDMDLPPKEIHKHCSKYLQAVGSGQHHHPRPGASQLSAGSGIRTDRPHELRLSGYKSDNSIGRDGRDPRDEPHRERGREGSLADPTLLSGTLRAAASPIGGPPNLNSRPTSWGPQPVSIPPGTPGASTPTGPGPTGTSASNFIAMPMPTPHVNGSAVTSPTFQQHAAGLQHPLPSLPSPGWRGPFQGTSAGGSNGSRQSSRGSAPPSPGVPEADRRSFQMERDRSRDRAWTPNQ